MGRGFGIVNQFPGHVDMFYNNTVVMTNDGAYGDGACSGDAMPVLGNNTIYSPTGNVSAWGCGSWSCAGVELYVFADHGVW